jgi:hypothetical protein
MGRDVEAENDRGTRVRAMIAAIETLKDMLESTAISDMDPDEYLAFLRREKERFDGRRARRDAR